MIKSTDNRTLFGIIFVAGSLLIGSSFIYFTLTDQMMRAEVEMILDDRQFGLFSTVWLLGVILTFFVGPAFGALQITTEITAEFDAETESIEWTKTKWGHSRSQIYRLEEIEIRNRIWSGLIRGVFIHGSYWVLRCPHGDELILTGDEVVRWKQILT